MSRPPSIRTRVVRGIAAVAVVAGSIVMATGPNAAAVHDETFELDGDIIPNSSAGAPNVDWTDFFNVSSGNTDPLLNGNATPKPEAQLPAGFSAPAFIKDFTTVVAKSGPNKGTEVALTADGTTFTTNSKDTLDISAEWRCVGANNVSDKGDLVNVYASAYRSPITDENEDGIADLILYFAAEKNDASGTNNIGVWFLQDENVACQEGGTGSGNAFTGDHVDDDILLVSEFTDGGRQANITAYKWDNGALVTLGSGEECPAANVVLADDRLCAITNVENNVNPPWDTWNKDDGSLDYVAPQQFYEGAINVSGYDVNPCITTLLANTRSSKETTASLYDFALGSFPVCGDLTVSKYIDVNADGDFDSGTDVTTGNDVGGYSFTVTGPAPSTTVVCSGTTSTTDGSLSCTTGSLVGLQPGTYTVTETQKTGFYNTDPGPNPNRSATVSKTVVVGVDGANVSLGNTCYVDKTFQITSVPDFITSVKVEYRIMAGDGASASYSSPVSLVKNGTTWSATVNDTFVQANSIAWRWYINDDTVNKVVGASEAAPESLATYGYPTCAKTNTDALDRVTLTGEKWKDVDNNGLLGAGDLSGGAGWEVKLYVKNADGTTGALLATTTTAANGSFSFTNVEPGRTYRMIETVPTGWVQTAPASPGYIDQTVVLGQSSPIDVGDFLNHPLSKIDVTLTALADNPGDGSDATKAKSITCVLSGSQDALPDTNGAVNTESVTNLPIGTYVCTVEIEDP